MSENILQKLRCLFVPIKFLLEGCWCLFKSSGAVGTSNTPTQCRLSSTSSCSPDGIDCQKAMWRYSSVLQYRWWFFFADNKNTATTNHENRIRFEKTYRLYLTLSDYMFLFFDHPILMFFTASNSYMFPVPAAHPIISVKKNQDISRWSTPGSPGNQGSSVWLVGSWLKLILFEWE